MNCRSWIAVLLVGCLGWSVAPAPVAAQQFLGQDWTKWDKDLKHANAKVRRGGAFALGKIGAPASPAVPHLTSALRKDKDARVQEAAAYALGEICAGGARATTAEVLNALCDALTNHPDAAVQQSAAVALGNIGLANPTVLASLTGQATNKSNGVRQNVAWALGKVGDDNIAVLRQLLQQKDQPEKDAQVQLNAVNSIDAHPTPKAQEARGDLLKCCAEVGRKTGEEGVSRRTPQEVELLRAVLITLVKLVGPDDQETAGPLIAVLKDRDPEVRRNAALALGNIGGEPGKAAVAVLRELLRTGELEEKRQAAAAIKNIGEFARDAVEDLRAALKDRDAKLRMYAAVALGGLKKYAEPAAADLAALVTKKDEDPQLRVEAAVALSRIGSVPGARAAAVKLLEVVEDSTAPMRVRERVMWALRVHLSERYEVPGLFPAMAKLMVDAREPEAKMLRYDCAYLLGVFKGPDAPKETIDVLYDFLRDEKIQIYGGTSGQVVGSGAEKKGGGSDVKEKHVGDGRVMAVQALQFMAQTKAGRDRIVQQQPQLVGQLQAIAKSTPFPDLREKANKLLDQLK